MLTINLTDATFALLREWLGHLEWVQRIPAGANGLMLVNGSVAEAERALNHMQWDWDSFWYHKGTVATDCVPPTREEHYALMELRSQFLLHNVDQCRSQRSEPSAAIEQVPVLVAA